jgi:hypothetical protein
VVLQVRLQVFHEVSVIHPEFVPAVVFSQKYWVPAGLPLAVQLDLMQLWVTLENGAIPGILANVYLEAGEQYPVSIASPFLALARKE